MKTIEARRAELILSYNGYDLSLDIAKDLLDFTYTDAPPGELDDLQITLQDRNNLWQSPEWMPLPGDSLKAEIRTHHWEKEGEVKKLPLGDFEVDSFQLTGAPDTVSIKGVSLGVGSSIRQEKRTKAWEKATLKTIAGEIAKRAGLKLSYNAPVNPTYDRLDQTEVSDLAFLFEQARAEGLSVKISGKQLVLFDDFEFEKLPVVATFKRGRDRILSYDFNWSSSYASYVACEISYSKAKSKKTIKVKYTPPGAPNIGPILKINEQVDSEAEALRKARNALREKNREMGEASLSVVGDIRIAAGVTIQVEGFGTFDGKYLVINVSHGIGSSGYITNMTIRPVLGW